MPTLYPLARAALFNLPAETAHEIVLQGLAAVPRSVRARIRRRSHLPDPRLRSRLFGLEFANPIGLAAGLDKSGRAFNALGALGFGFIEIGTVTAHAQPGNPRPRLFRLPADSALLNRMGFNNPGAEEVASRLQEQPVETVLGINVGKSKVTPLEAAVEDYLYSIERLEPYAHYLVVNVSSPNTPGLRQLQDAGPLRALLSAVVAREPDDRSRPATPVLVKIAPDLTETQVDQAVDIALDVGAAGVVIANTTTSREGLRTPAETLTALGAGGISGRPLNARALALVAHVYRETGGSIPIIGVGGVFDANDAWERIRAGASLLQLYTGLIYEGPGVMKRINQGLLDYLDRTGIGSIPEAVGTGIR